AWYSHAAAPRLNAGVVALPTRCSRIWLYHAAAPRLKHHQNLRTYRNRGASRIWLASHGGAADNHHEAHSVKTIRGVLAMSRLLPCRTCLGVFLLAAAVLGSPGGATAADPYVPFDGEKSSWHEDFDRYDYLMDDKTLDIQPFKR